MQATHRETHSYKKGTPFKTNKALRTRKQVSCACVPRPKKCEGEQARRNKPTSRESMANAVCLSSGFLPSFPPSPLLYLPSPYFSLQALNTHNHIHKDTLLYQNNLFLALESAFLLCLCRSGWRQAGARRGREGTRAFRLHADGTHRSPTLI